MAQSKHLSLRAKFVSMDTIEVCVVDHNTKTTASMRWKFDLTHQNEEVTDVCSVEEE